MAKLKHGRWPEGIESTNEFVRSAVPLLAAFGTHTLALGVAMTNGLFYPIFLQNYSAGSSLTAWSCSLGLTMLFLLSPLASMLMDRVGICKAAILGGLFVSSGLLGTAFASNIYMVFLFMGIVSGLGYGVMWNTAINVVVLSFKKYRTIAVALSVTGVGMGTFLYPLLVNYVIDIYGWRGTMLLTSGISLHLCVCGALMGLQSRVSVTKYDGLKLNNVDSRHEVNTAELKEHTSTILGSGEIAEDREVCHPNDNVSVDRAKDNHVKSSVFSHMYLRLNRFALFYYVLLHVNNFLLLIGLSVVFTHTTAYAMSLGHSAERSRVLMSALGLASIAGRVLLGLLAHQSFVDATLLYSVSFMLTGVATLVMTFWTSYAGLLFAVSALGFFFTPTGSLLPEVTLRIVGERNFNYAYGFLMLTDGLGYLVGAPLAGWVYHVTHKYYMSFYLGAASFLLSGLVLIPPWIMNKVHKQLKDDFAEMEVTANSK